MVIKKFYLKIVAQLFSAKHTGEASVWFSRIYVGPYHCQHSSNHLLHTRNIWNISDESTICSSGKLLECQFAMFFISVQTQFFLLVKKIEYVWKKLIYIPVFDKWYSVDYKKNL